MPSSYSPLLRFEEIGAGEQSGLWGDTTNKNLGELVEQAIAGVTTVSLSGGAGSYTLSALNGALDESRGAVLKFIGTPSGAKNIIIPTSTKLYVVRNECGQTIVVKTTAQVGGVTILTGEATLVFCDGTSAVAGIATAGVGPTTVANGGTGATGFGAGGFIKSPGTTGTLTAQAAIVLNSADVTGTLPVTSGGTGATNFTSGGLLKGAGGSAVTSLVGTVNGQVVAWDGVQGWIATTPSSGVASFSGGTTGLTPSTATTGAVTLGGTLAVSNGGTGATTATAARVSLGIGTVATVNLPSPSSTSTFLRGDGTFATPPTGTGTVTSVAVSGGTTGLTTSGGPITGSGTITLAGTLAIANGGTGSSTKNFVDLTTTQTVGGAKTFTSDTVFENTGTTRIRNLAAAGATLNSSMTFGANFINFYDSTTGNGWNSIGYGADSTALADQAYQFAYKTPGVESGTLAYNFIGDGTAQKTGGGSWASVSDSRLKDNVTPLTGALNKITSLNPVSYTWKIEKANEPTVGFIAQDVQRIMPNAVTSHKPTEKEAQFVQDKTLTIGWQNDMTAYLVGAIKELKAELDAAKDEIAALKAKA